MGLNRATGASVHLLLLFTDASEAFIPDSSRLLCMSMEQISKELENPWAEKQTATDTRSGGSSSYKVESMDCMWPIPEPFFSYTPTPNHSPSCNFKFCFLKHFWYTSPLSYSVVTALVQAVVITLLSFCNDF